MAPQFIAHIACGGSVRTALVRELQRNGITGRIEHADFGEIDPAKKLHVHIQIQLLGDPVGVRSENGVLEQHVRSIVVSCLPKDAIETLPVDVSGLHKGDDIKVKDLALEVVRVELQELGLAGGRGEHARNEAGTAETARGGGAVDGARFGDDVGFLCHVWPFLVWLEIR